MDDGNSCSNNLVFHQHVHRALDVSSPWKYLICQGENTSAGSDPELCCF